MSKKAVSLVQLEEALRDLARWIREKLNGYVAEPAAEGESGWVLTTNGDGGRSWEAPEEVNIRGLKLFNPNLLDNGDFSDPVNLRGQTSYAASTDYRGLFTIDRWLSVYGVLTLKDGYINWESAGAADNKRLIQRCGMKFIAGKTYTLAMLARVNALSGRAYLRVANNLTAVSGASTQLNTTADFEWIVLSHTAAADIDIPSFDILVGSTASDYMDIDIKAAAIYEGKYTVDNLPEYRPKGYETEMAVCSQYNPYTGEYKGVYSMDVLWENASPASSFSAQTVTVDLGAYDFIVIEAAYYSTSPERFTNWCRVGSTTQMIAPIATSRIIFSARKATVGETGVTFTGGTYQQLNAESSSTNDGACVPLMIYGIRGVA